MYISTVRWRSLKRGYINEVVYVYMGVHMSVAHRVHAMYTYTYIYTCDICVCIKNWADVRVFFTDYVHAYLIWIIVKLFLLIIIGTLVVS